jgi:hypothetical protein
MKGVEIRYTLDKSNPDKNSLLLTPETVLTLTEKNNKTLKTIAYKEGWEASKIQNFTFFNRGIVPNNFEVTYDGILGEYLGYASNILIDNYVLNNSGIDFSRYWAGFNKKPLIAIAEFEDNSTPIKEIVLSCGFKTHKAKRYPIKFAEVWISTDKINWKLQSKKTFKNLKVRKTKNISFKINAKNTRFLKIVVHASKGQTFFVNQIFFH